jgi:quercetin dioxygenase-like cupin family protein
MAKHARTPRLPGAHAVPGRPIGQQVGERIASLRRQLDLTLDDLAAGTGMTRSYLSKLERGLTSISVDNLRSVAHCLGVEMVYFFERDPRSTAVVTRRGTGTPLSVGKTSAIAETLITTTRSTLQATLYRTPPGEGRSAGFSHPGEEMVYVLRGAIRYVVAEQEFELRSGDCLWHASTEPHRWTNEGRSDAVSLHVNTPPVW